MHSERTPLNRPPAAGEDEFFRHAPIGMARVSTSGLILAVNRSFCAMLGYGEEELLGRHLLEFARAEDREPWIARFRSLLEEHGGDAPAPIETAYLCKDGGRLTVLISTTARLDEDGRTLYFLSQVVDVTEARKQRDLLELSAGVLRMIASGAELPDVIETLVANLESSTPGWRVAVAVHRGSEQRLRIVHGPSLPSELRRALEGQPIGPAGGSSAAAIHTGARVVVEDVAVHPAWRELCDVALSEGVRAVWSEPVRLRGGSPLGALSVYLTESRSPSAFDAAVLENAANLVGIALDHDERESSLRKSEDKLRTILHAIGDAVLTTDANGRVAGLNSAATLLTGWSAEKARGSELGRVLQVTEPGGSCYDAQQQAGPGEPWTWAGKIVAQTGDVREVALHGWPIPAAADESVSAVLVLRDVGEERQREAQLRQSNKLEAVGQLAGGIAHDFNNLLTGILGNAELLSATGSQANRTLAEDIVEASSRAAKLTAQLLTFSRVERVDDGAVDVHVLLDEVAELLERSLDPRIQIHRDFRAERADVRGDSSQLRNTILHLALNARDAMPGGGELHLETELAGDASGQEELHLRVRDTGVGISDAALERIFEPFYTTKPVGEGSGLGLAGVYGSVQSHGGRVWAESAPGRGAVFHVRLPLLRTAETEEWLLTYGDGHVLVVDDEEVIRNYAETALVRLGYTVTVASDGIEALELLEEGGVDPDVVVLDMILPEMGGAEVFRCIRDLRPGLPVLLSSGGSEDDVIEELLREGAAGFLSKPFRVEELGMTIGLALERGVRPQQG